MDIKKLVKISTFAREQNKSITWIYKLALEKELKLVIIDGVKFIEKKED